MSWLEILVIGYFFGDFGHWRFALDIYDLIYNVCIFKYHTGIYLYILSLCV